MSRFWQLPELDSWPDLHEPSTRPLDYDFDTYTILSSFVRAFSLFTTRRGLFGLAIRSRIQVGESVAIVAGCTVPLLLRKSERCGHQGMELVGVALVQGEQLCVAERAPY